MVELTEYQKEILRVAQLSVGDIPKSLTEMNKLIWEAYNYGLKHKETTNSTAIDDRVDLDKVAKESSCILHNVSKCDVVTILVNYFDDLKAIREI